MILVHKQYNFALKILKSVQDETVKKTSDIYLLKKSLSRLLLVITCNLSILAMLINLAWLGAGGNLYTCVDISAI